MADAGDFGNLSAPKVRLMVRLLQQLALAQVLREVAEVLRESGRAQVPGWDDASIADRTSCCHTRIVILRRYLSVEDVSEVRVCRAVYLRELLASSSFRLDGWSDLKPVATVPISHLYEWLSNDLERLELSILEKTMTPLETGRYRRLVALRHRLGSAN